MDYFRRVAAAEQTRVWVNNPSLADAQAAVAVGAVGCTTNPQFCQKLLQLEPDYIYRIIDEVVRDTSDLDVAAERVYQKAVARIMEVFLPIYLESGGRSGFVTIQGDPRRDHAPDAIVDEALRFRECGENYMAKIAATGAGLKAMESLIADGVPVCATEVFSVSQAIACCEMYQRVVGEGGRTPPFYVTHITGILDEYWQGLVSAEKIDVSSDALEHAGCTVAREEYRLLKERGYDAVMLGGGARGVRHFTEMVGADMCVTLNWSTMAELLAEDPSVENRFAVEATRALIEEMGAKIPGFTRSFAEDGLAVDEFEDFGPLVLFRTNFLNGYARLIDAIADRRPVRRESGVAVLAS